MKKGILAFLIVTGLFIFSRSFVFAGGVNLSSIGSVDTSGKQISHWWYTGTVATLKGGAMAGSTVNVSIDGTEDSTTADSDGNWTYTPSSLTDGDHSIILTSDGSTISFTLTLGAENVDWDVVKGGEGDALPAAGIIFPTLALTMVGSGFLLTAKKIAKKN